MKQFTAIRGQSYTLPSVFFKNKRWWTSVEHFTVDTGFRLLVVERKRYEQF